jgi:hypothetical protein
VATLIAVYNSEGCVGRCDAKCYEATSAECDCICGGRNHGAGRQKAMDNTRAYCEEWIEAYQKEHGLEDDLAWAVPAGQLGLPLLEAAVP